MPTVKERRTVGQPISLWPPRPSTPGNGNDDAGVIAGLVKVGYSCLFARRPNDPKLQLVDLDVA